MSRDVVRAIALGIGGLVVAIVLTAGAFAIAGQDISQPAGVPTLAATQSPDHERDDDSRSPDPKKTASPSVDDHGGGSGSDDGGSTATEGPDDHGSGSGSDDHGGSGGSSGSGSGSGSNTSGSNSGSGSDSSGSGSGSGSDDSGEHEDD